MKHKKQFLMFSGLGIAFLLLSMVLHVVDQIHGKVGFHVDANLVLPTLAIFFSVMAIRESNKPN
jgi:hypothetical protein